MTSNTGNSVTIEGIYACPVGSGTMTSKTTANLIQGFGLEGDRYAQQVGTYSALIEPGRQLTLISADGVEEALAASTLKNISCIGDLRRNIVLRGISSQELLNAIGSVISLGPTAKVFVHRHCVPCMYNERKNNLPGLMEAIWDASGVSCEVIESGAISVGEPVKILFDHDGDGRIANDGGKPNGFYTRPMNRSAEMVHAILEQKKKTKEHLQHTNQEGLLRLQQSYESVGLKF